MECSQPAEGNEVTLEDCERVPCEIWTRVMGYHRPVSAFNLGKRAEFAERTYFREQDARGSARCAKPGI